MPKLRTFVENEFNFLLERDNLRDAREFFQGNPFVHIPKVYPELCSRRMVVMEYCEGVKINDIDTLKKRNIDLHQLGQICLTTFADMIFRSSKLHIDPHAGNLFVRLNPQTKEPQLILLDHGMYMYYRKSFNEDFQKLWLAMISQDKEEIKKCCEPWGMEEYSEVLSVVFTGRSSQWNHKLGEQMSEEEMQEMREKMMEKMKNTPVDKQKIEEHMKKMEAMMKVIPLELMAVLRVQMLVGLVWEIECS